MKRVGKRTLRRRHSIARAAKVPALADQAHALTFFLTHAQRAAVLQALRASGPQRAEALLKALGIHHTRGGRR